MDKNLNGVISASIKSIKNQVKRLNNEEINNLEVLFIAQQLNVVNDLFKKYSTQVE